MSSDRRDRSGQRETSTLECGPKAEWRKESSESLLAPLYAMYKGFVTTCFAGVVKVPLIVKCAYIDYLKALEVRQAELDKERKIKKKAG
ncbi:unnamed protein product, partial [Brenthis ino]